MNDDNVVLKIWAQFYSAFYLTHNYGRGLSNDKKLSTFWSFFFQNIKNFTNTFQFVRSSLFWILFVYFLYLNSRISCILTLSIFSSFIDRIIYVCQFSSEIRVKTQQIPFSFLSEKHSLFSNRVIIQQNSLFIWSL